MLRPQRFASLHTPHLEDDYHSSRPQLGDAGEPLPTVLTIDDAGADYSNLWFERTAVNMGSSGSFTGLCRPGILNPDGTVSGEPDPAMVNEPSLPWCGLFIVLKGKSKKGQLDPMLAPTIGGLFNNRPGQNSAPLQNPSELAFLQCATLLVENDVPSQGPQINSVAVLKRSAWEAMARLLEEAHLAGIDVFHPENGCCIKFWGIPSGTLPNQNTLPSSAVSVTSRATSSPSTTRTLRVTSAP